MSRPVNVSSFRNIGEIEQRKQQFDLVIMDGPPAPVGRAGRVRLYVQYLEISDRLGKLAIFYHQEAGRCLRGRAYLAAFVMQGAALEAVLQAMCFLYPDDVKKTSVYEKQQKRDFRRKRNKALEFKYVQLIDIAAELQWFPTKVITWGKRTTLAGFVHELRNYIHPGVWASERPQTVKFTKAVYEVVYEIFDVANSWLVHRVHESLRRKMNRDEQKGKP